MWWSPWSVQQNIQVIYGGMYSISPNPAASTITVKQKEQTDAVSTGISEVKIFDQVGNLKKQSKHGTGTRQVQMSISDLQSGIYIIEVTSGQYKEKQQLILQK